MIFGDRPVEPLFSGFSGCPWDIRNCVLCRHNVRMFLLPPRVQWNLAGGPDTLDLVITGAVRIPPITRYKLSDAAAAHVVSEGRHLRGKLVFEVR